MPGRENPQVERIAVAAYRIPTDSTESDGTLVWDSTTVVLAQAYAAGAVGLGYSYTHPAAAVLIRDLLSALVEGSDSRDVPGAWRRMIDSTRILHG